MMVVGKLCLQIGPWICVFAAIVFLVASIFRRDFIHLVLAAWSFIIIVPLLQVLMHVYQLLPSRPRAHSLTASSSGIQPTRRDETRQVCARCCSYDHNDVEKEVEYKVWGNVVEEQERKQLDVMGTVFYEFNSNEEPPIDESKVEKWYTDHKDKHWYYRAGSFSLVFAILKAILNVYSIIRTPFRYHLLTLDHDQPGYVGIVWVVSIELPYMLCVILTPFLFTVVQLGGWCTSLDSKEEVRAVVRLSGLLKSVGRFSALNLLEFIRIDDFMEQDLFQQVMSGIGAVIGFMAFRCKILEIAFVINQHSHDWTLGQWVRICALVNNMVSITDRKEKMISIAIETKGYRKSRWVQAVAVHLFDLFKEPSTGWSGWHRCLAFRRLVSLGPHDVSRLIEDLRIDYVPQSGSYTRKMIPKQSLDACWNWHFTNVVGVVRLGFFFLLAREAEYTHPEKENQEPLQRGKLYEAELLQYQRAKDKQKEAARLKDHEYYRSKANLGNHIAEGFGLLARTVSGFWDASDAQSKLAQAIDAKKVADARIVDLQEQLTKAHKAKEDANVLEVVLQDELAKAKKAEVADELFIKEQIAACEGPPLEVVVDAHPGSELSNASVAVSSAPASAMVPLISEQLVEEADRPHPWS